MEENTCWLCLGYLDEEEVQYCSDCELAMLKEILEKENHESI